MPFYQLDTLEIREVMPGFRGKFVHSNHMTLAYWKIDAGAQLPEHSHPHEQVVNVMKGEFELIVEGKGQKLKAGSVAVIPPHAIHSGKSVTACEILDVFQPVREDYR